MFLRIFLLRLTFCDLVTKVTSTNQSYWVDVHTTPFNFKGTSINTFYFIILTDLMPFLFSSLSCLAMSRHSWRCTTWHQTLISWRTLWRRWTPPCCRPWTNGSSSYSPAWEAAAVTTANTNSSPANRPSPAWTHLCPFRWGKWKCVKTPEGF